MSQSVARVLVHLVFSTKERRPLLRSHELRTELYAYMAAILRDSVDSPALQIGGVEDHVHALFSLSRKVPIMSVVQEAKTETTKWLKQQSKELQNMQWQGGYGAFSVSESKVEDVKRYIANQADHHRRRTFQDEFRELCQRHRIALDERYAWD